MDPQQVFNEVLSYRIAGNYAASWLLTTATHNREESALQTYRSTDDLPDTDSKLGPAMFVLLAEEISIAAAAKKEKPVGLQTIIGLLESAIRGRRNRALWCRGGKSKADKVSDDGHAHFIEALEKALDHLKAVDKEGYRQAKEPKKASKARKKNTKSSAQATMANLFKQLNLEETSEGFQALKITPPKCVTEALVVEIEDVEGEAEYALFLFFQEVKKVRNFLRSTWTELKTARILPQHASVVAEAAIRLLETEAQSLAEAFPQFACFNGLAECLELNVCVKDGELTDIAVKDAQEVELLAEDACIPAWTLLQLLVGYHKSKTSSLAQNGLETSDFGVQLLNGHPLGRNLIELYPHIEYMAVEFSAGRWKLPLNAFTTDLLDTLSNQGKDISISAVISLQIQMDIADVLDDFRLTIVDKPSDVHAAALADVLPLFAGWLAWDQARKNHQRGISVCESDNVVIAAAHLYQLYKKCSPNPTQWGDMESFIEMQGTKTLGLQSAAVNPMLNAVKNFGITMGLRVQDHVAIRRAFQTPEFRIQLPEPDSQKRPSLPSASTFLRLRKEADSSNDRFPRGRELSAILHALARSMIQKGRASLEASVVQHWKTSGILTNVQMLQVLKASLEAEKFQVAFNYAGFCANCVGVMYRLCEQLRGTQGLNEQDGTTLCEMVYSILWSAACYEGNEALPRSRRRKDDALQLPGLVQVSVTALNRWGEKEDSRMCVLEARKSMRPARLQRIAKTQPATKGTGATMRLLGSNLCWG